MTQQHAEQCVQVLMTKPLSLVERAEEYGRAVHADQKRKYTGEPYAIHLQEVATLVRLTGAREEVEAAAWLHDSIEDQGATVADLAKLFGHQVARIVDEVTDRSQPSDGNRAARKAVDREWLSQASPEAKTLKLGDLISNTSSIVLHDPKFAKIYLAEKRLLLPLLVGGDINLMLWASTLADSR